MLNGSEWTGVRHAFERAWASRVRVAAGMGYTKFYPLLKDCMQTVTHSSLKGKRIGIDLMMMLHVAAGLHAAEYVVKCTHCSISRCKTSPSMKRLKENGGSAVCSRREIFSRSFALSAAARSAASLALSSRACECTAWSRSVSSSASSRFLPRRIATPRSMPACCSAESWPRNCSKMASSCPVASAAAPNLASAAAISDLISPKGRSGGPTIFLYKPVDPSRSAGQWLRCSRLSPGPASFSDALEESASEAAHCLRLSSFVGHFTPSATSVCLHQS
mmetsp:Transcript_34274/g.80871  ORF Transcript_34274/g.80871 Transcript_34274/m.80871 type:complete len:276 (+) Transcript_34274:170-997(+)